MDASKLCREEFNLARLRHTEEENVLYPILLRTAELPLYMRAIHYLDCREADAGKLRSAAVVADVFASVTLNPPRRAPH